MTNAFFHILGAICTCWNLKTFKYLCSDKMVEKSAIFKRVMPIKSQKVLSHMSGKIPTPNSVLNGLHGLILFPTRFLFT